MGDAREGQLANPYQYQGDYSEFDDETGWNDFALRSYDPQTGRFINADPYDQFASPYVGMGNDPVNNIDPSGGWVFSAIPLIEHGAWAIGGAVAGMVISGASSGWDITAMKQGAGIGFGVGLGASFINWGNVGSAIGNAGSWVGNKIKYSSINDGDYKPNDNPCKKKYDGYDATKDVEEYNCAGLAFRTYRWMNLPEVEYTIDKNKKSNGREGDIKVWLWTYDIHLELEDGTVIPNTSKSDFHIVGGILGEGGKDPTKVYTKNGARPVFGPSKPTSWKPAAKDQARSNDRLNTPQSYNGQKVMKVRTNMVQRTYILPCVKF
jgi:RHS repeat-associated protein